MLQIFSTNTYKREFILIFGIQQNPCQSALSTSLSGRFALLLVWSINTHPTVYGPLQTLTLMIRDLKHDTSCSCRTKGMRVQWGHITDRSPLSKKKKAFCDGVCIFIPFYDRSSSTAVDQVLELATTNPWKSGSTWKLTVTIGTWDHNSHIVKFHSHIIVLNARNIENS